MNLLNSIIGFYLALQSYRQTISDMLHCVPLLERGSRMIPRRLVFRNHATQRIMQRGIHARDIRFVLEYGEVIEDYPDDFPHPSQLLLGWVRGRPLHVVAADHPTQPIISVITV